MIPLSALADPAAFLQGWHGPAGHVVAGDWVVIGGWPYHRAPKKQNYHPVNIYEAVKGGLALDPSDPDVARWCDRRIAEACSQLLKREIRHLGRWIELLTAPDYRARRPDRVHWSMAGTFATWGPDGRTREPGLPDVVALASIPCDDAHIPTARAALVLALFGRTP